MGLEATMICLDNSEFARNGDYAPSRWEAQQDAANLICGAKTQQNPESAVGLLTMAGARVDVLVTPTGDLGKMLSALHTVQIHGDSDFIAALSVAQLALKHRQNKNQRQRIVVFVGSPVGTDEKSLVALGKKLKKNNVAVDVVNFGEIEENTEKLQAFVSAVNSNDNSHMVAIPPGPHVLSDILLSSPIVVGEDGVPAAAAGSGAAGGAGYEFGVDPNLDPELAMALRISMEEERARQERLNPTSAAPAATTGGDTVMADAAQPVQAVTPSVTQEVDMHDDEALLQQAIQMSMLAESGQNATEDDMTRALRLSMAQSSSPSPPALHTPANTPAGTTAATPAPASQMLFQDPNFVNNLLASLPGVDPNDERIRAVLQQMQSGAQQPKPEDKPEEKK